MPDTFVPLAPANAARQEAAFTPLAPKVSAAQSADAAAKPALEEILAASGDASHSPEVCAKPGITLQRDGEVVTGVRIQCGCGRVTEFTFVY